MKFNSKKSKIVLVGVRERWNEWECLLREDG